VLVSSQTARPVPTRGGVGAVLGALLGAIGGVDQSASAGATGTILTIARDRFELEQGSEFLITSANSATSVPR
jgi:hypothetical protein